MSKHNFVPEISKINFNYKIKSLLHSVKPMDDRRRCPYDDKNGNFEELSSHANLLLLFHTEQSVRSQSYS